MLSTFVRFVPFLVGGFGPPSPLYQSQTRVEEKGRPPSVAKPATLAQIDCGSIGEDQLGTLLIGGVVGSPPSECTVPASPCLLFRMRISNHE